MKTLTLTLTLEQYKLLDGAVRFHADDLTEDAAQYASDGDAPKKEAAANALEDVLTLIREQTQAQGVEQPHLAPAPEPAPKVHTFRALAHFASYILEGDARSITSAEKDNIDAFLKVNGWTLDKGHYSQGNVGERGRSLGSCDILSVIGNCETFQFIERK